MKYVNSDSLIQFSVCVSRYVISVTVFMIGAMTEGVVLNGIRSEENEAKRAIIPLTSGLVPAAFFGIAAGVSQISTILRQDQDELLHFYDDLTVSICVILFNLLMRKSFQHTNREACCEDQLSTVLSMLCAMPTWFYLFIGAADYFRGSQVPVFLTTATIAVIPLAIDSLVSSLFSSPMDQADEEQENFDQHFVLVAGIG